MLNYVITLAVAGLTVLLTLQRRKWVWQSRIVATLLPFAAIVLASTNNSTVDFVLCGLALWATARALQVLLPPGETIRGFAVALRPGGNRGLAAHLMHFVTLKIGGLVLLFKHVSGDAAAAAAIQEKRIVARDGALEAQRAIPGALGFRLVHWVAAAEIGGVWILLTLAKIGSPAATFSLAVPVVLVTSAYVLRGRTVGFAEAAAAPHTSLVTAN
jgi:hypothetical protein